MSAADQALRLRPMTPEEFPTFVAATTAEYAHDIEEHGGQTHAAALQKADDDMAAVLAQGRETPGHHVFVVEASGIPVGRLWLAQRALGGRQVMYIYEISIEAEFRGHGYGRGAMLLAEDEARAHGIRRLELNVFGGNEVARRLYRSLGYIETSVHMAKDLDPA
ncbi:MAG: N-acetyltransferase family protein [Candidatus Limnocylindria bacterium]